MTLGDRVIDDQDELLWGAAWLYKATKIDTYRQYLVNNADTLGGATVQVNAFNWDSKYAGAQILSAQVRTDELPSLHGLLRLYMRLRFSKEGPVSKSCVQVLAE